MAKPNHKSKERTRKDPTSLVVLRAAFTEALSSCGQTIRVRNDGPMVKAVDVDHVRTEFNHRYTTSETDPKKRADAQRQAFKRGLEKINFNSLTQDGIEWMWP
jgi:hypothetical protein